MITKTSTRIGHNCGRPYKIIHNQTRQFETLQGQTGHNGKKWNDMIDLNQMIKVIKLIKQINNSAWHVLPLWR